MIDNRNREFYLVAHRRSDYVECILNKSCVRVIYVYPPILQKEEDNIIYLSILITASSIKISTVVIKISIDCQLMSCVFKSVRLLSLLGTRVIL